MMVSLAAKILILRRVAQMLGLPQGFAVAESRPASRQPFR
jgi:hypothetical protein